MEYNRQGMRYARHGRDSRSVPLDRYLASPLTSTEILAHFTWQYRLHVCDEERLEDENWLKNWQSSWDSMSISS